MKMYQTQYIGTFVSAYIGHLSYDIFTNPTLTYPPSNTPKPSVTILLSLSRHRSV